MCLKRELSEVVFKRDLVPREGQETARATQSPNRTAVNSSSSALCFVKAPQAHVHCNLESDNYIILRIAHLDRASHLLLLSALQLPLPPVGFCLAQYPYSCHLGEVSMPASRRASELSLLSSLSFDPYCVLKSSHFTPRRVLHQSIHTFSSIHTVRPTCTAINAPSVCYHCFPPR